MVRKPKTFSTREFARRHSTTEWRLNDLLRRYKIDEPVRFGSRRVWTDEDDARVKSALAAHEAKPAVSA